METWQTDNAHLKGPGSLFVLFAFFLLLVGSLQAGIAGAGQDGVISGYVVEAETGRPIAGEPVYIYTASSQQDVVRTDSSGWYEFVVKPGSYYVVTATTRHLNELYNNIPCPDTCPVTRGSRVEVRPGEAEGDVDFRLKSVRMKSASPAPSP